MWLAPMHTSILQILHTYPMDCFCLRGESMLSQVSQRPLRHPRHLRQKQFVGETWNSVMYKQTDQTSLTGNSQWLDRGQTDSWMLPIALSPCPMPDDKTTYDGTITISYCYCFLRLIPKGIQSVFNFENPFIKNPEPLWLACAEHWGNVSCYSSFLLTFDKNPDQLLIKSAHYCCLFYTLRSKSLTWNTYTFSSGCNVLAFYVLYMYIHANSEWLTIISIDS